jgi:hypothetical protein
MIHRIIWLILFPFRVLIYSLLFLIFITALWLLSI